MTPPLTCAVSVALIRMKQYLTAEERGMIDAILEKDKWRSEPFAAQFIAQIINGVAVSVPDELLLDMAEAYCRQYGWDRLLDIYDVLPGGSAFYPLSDEILVARYDDLRKNIKARYLIDGSCTVVINTELAMNKGNSLGEHFSFVRDIEAFGCHIKAFGYRRRGDGTCKFYFQDKEAAAVAALTY